MTTATTTWTVDIKPGDVFSDSMDCRLCIIITAIEGDNVLFEDRSGEGGRMSRDQLEDWQRLSTDYQQRLGWRLAKLQAEFSIMESTCEAFQIDIRGAIAAGDLDREWDLCMQQRRVALEAMHKLREIRQDAALLKYSLEN